MSADAQKYNPERTPKDGVFNEPTPVLVVQYDLADVGEPNQKQIEQAKEKLRKD
jgi:hypothetical protein